MSRVIGKLVFSVPPEDGQLVAPEHGETPFTSCRTAPWRRSMVGWLLCETHWAMEHGMYPSGSVLTAVPSSCWTAVVVPTIVWWSQAGGLVALKPRVVAQNVRSPEPAT